MSNRVILPGDGEKPTGEDADPTVVLQEGIRTITDTTVADKHTSGMAIRRELEDQFDDWGDGFYVDPEPVLIQRAPDGGITNLTHLSDIPGVRFQSGQILKDNLTKAEVEASIKEVEGKPVPFPMTRKQRGQLTQILAQRLYNYFQDRGPNDPRWNPFREGIPELPAGSPEHLQPLPGTVTYPATDGQIMAYLVKFIGERTQIIDRQRFGKGHLQDLAIRIE